MNDIEKNQLIHKLFSSSVSANEYKITDYQNHLFEQYKLYVEMADRVSNRRGLTNIFFATLNTTLLTAIVGFLNNNDRSVIVLHIAGILICIIWGVLLRSYRNLNTSKFTVIGLLEEKLPASVYWHGEWYALGSGKDFKKYIPLGPIEIYIPIIYAVLFLILFLAEFF
ncbi:MAG: small integral membrane protein [uncultured bacterium]|nr:MAG: small integral membrane protein [uncultured bacterium]